ncbi:MAG: alpha/beta fold hydrolase [Promethearchaeota archaeon]
MIIPKLKYETGMFLGKIPYLKQGDGPKNLVIFPQTHHLMWRFPIDAESQARGMRFFVPEEYSLYILAYDPNLPKDHTSESIAADFAKIIREKIGPSVILAISYGGSIAIPFAALYPELTTKLILLVTSYGTSEAGIKFGEELLQLAKDGKTFTLRQQMDNLYANKLLSRIDKLNTWRSWPSKEKEMNPISTFINAYTYLLKTPTEREKYLSQIKAPTLIIGGTNDQFVSEEYYRKAAELIPNSHLKLYRGQTHMVVVEKFRSTRKIIKNFLRKN